MYHFCDHTAMLYGCQAFLATEGTLHLRAERKVDTSQSNCSISETLAKRFVNICAVYSTGGTYRVEGIKPLTVDFTVQR